MTSTLTASAALARRALRNTARRPQFVAPMLIFPSMFLAINVGGLNQTTTLPGFPEVDGFLDFQLAAAMTQSLLLGGVTAGIAIALEIEGGFFDRLVASPIPRSAIVFGRILSAAALAFGQVVFFLAVGFAFGAQVAGGPTGVLVILAIGTLAGMGFGAIGVFIALQARSASTVQGIFPLVFVILFVSSAFFPRELLSSPSDRLAQYNPLSYVAEGLREPIIDGVNGAETLAGLGASAGLVVVFVGLSLMALRGRLGAS